MNAQKRGERSDSVVINAKMPLNSEVNKVKKEMEKQNHFGTNDRVAKDITQSSALCCRISAMVLAGHLFWTLTIVALRDICKKKVDTNPFFFMTYTTFV